MGVAPPFLSFIQAWLVSRIYRVKLPTKDSFALSLFLASQLGPPRGGTASPIFWNGHANGPPKNIWGQREMLGLTTHRLVLSFADDAAVVIAHKDLNIFYNEIWVLY